MYIYILQQSVVKHVATEVWFMDAQWLLMSMDFAVVLSLHKNIWIWICKYF